MQSNNKIKLLQWKLMNVRRKKEKYEINATIRKHVHVKKKSIKHSKYDYPLK